MGGNGYRARGDYGGIERGSHVMSHANEIQLANAANDKFAGLNRDQKQALAEYLANSKEMKQMVRSGLAAQYQHWVDHGGPEPKLTDRQKELLGHVETLNQSLKDARISRQQVVYRSQSKTMSEADAKGLIGSTATESNFGSASMDFHTFGSIQNPNGGTGYAGEGEKMRVIRQITMPQGSHAAYVGGASKEYVMPVGAKYQVTGYERVRYGGQDTIVLKMRYMGVSGMAGRPRTYAPKTPKTQRPAGGAPGKFGRNRGSGPKGGMTNADHRAYQKSLWPEFQNPKYQ